VVGMIILVTPEPRYFLNAAVQLSTIVAGGVRMSGVPVPTRKRPSGVTS